MKIKTHIVKLLTICLISSATFSQAEFSLSEAKAYALENHLSIYNANLEVEKARQQIVETTGMGLPQIDLSGSLNNYLEIPVTVVDASFLDPNAPPGTLAEFQMGTDWNANGNLQVSQLIFNGSYIVGLQVSRFFKNFQETNAQLTREDVVFNVIQAYQIVAVAKENKVFADSLVIVTQDLVNKQENYLELGLMLQEEMDQLVFSLTQAKNQALTANIQYENAKAMLKLSMGYPMADQITITNTSDDLLSTNTISTGAITDNLNYQLMEQQINLSKFNLKNEKFASLPYLNGYYQLSYNAYRNEFDIFSTGQNWFPTSLWGVQLNIPVFSGLQRHARVQQAKVSLMQDQNSLSLLEQQLLYQEVDAKNKYRGAEDIYALQEENLDLAISIYLKSTLREEIGKENSIAVTQKYNQLILAQTGYLNSKIDLFQAKLNLDKLYNKILSK